MSIPTLVVLGANDIATFLLRWAPDLGYRTALVESRIDMITDEQRVSAGAVADSIDALTLDGVFDAVHCDHDAPAMVDELVAALRSGARIVMLMASRRRAPEFAAAIRARGVSDADAARVNTPAGLDLGGKAPAEIALSVLAGLVAAQYGRSGGWLAG